MRDCVVAWSAEHAYQHCLQTWQENFRQFPDLLEPYVVSLDAADTNDDRLRIMRQSLAETFKRRWPA